MTLTRGPLEVMAFEAANSRAYLRAVFAAWEQGHLVMALPQGAGSRTVPGTRVIERQSFDVDPGWFEASLPERPDGEPALIAFSSGTTGRPKAILLDHGALSDVVGRINAAMGLTAEVREYLGVPVTFSFGFARARAVAAVGGRAFLPERGFDPGEIGRMLAAGEINAVSAVPTLWRVVLANSDAIPEDARGKLRWIEIGSQWMAGAEKLALRDMFPAAKIVQHYGLTEASRTALLDVSDTPEGLLDSVGRETGNVEIAVDDEGRILTRGPHVAMGLVSGAGVKPVTDADGWFMTADQGRIEDGWVFYEGRTDELINVGGTKIDPTAFEQAVNAALGVPGAVAAGRLTDDLRGEKVLLALRADAGVSGEEVHEAAARVAEDQGLFAAGAVEIRKVAAHPLTPTGKVKRAELTGLPEVAAPPAAAEAPPTAPKGRAAELQALWAEILGREDIPLDRGFYDLGGDSLSALTAVMRMEAMGLDADTARGIFEGKTIAEMVGDDAPAPDAPSAPEPAPAGSKQRESVTASTGRAAELQALWAEILGRDDVPLDRGFYDLGGDSLSALTAVMRMEAMGLDAETARGIFEGKTIAEMVGDDAPAPDAPSAPEPAPAGSKQRESVTASTGRAAELQALWAEILGREDIPLDRGFYDLGGDSLSALTAVMRMEAMGLDADTARGIFEGKTIADLAGKATPGPLVEDQAPEPKAAPAIARTAPSGVPPAPVTPDIPASPPSPAAVQPGGLTLAQMVNAVHATRGLLILWVVVVHWLPGLLNRLGDDLQWIYQALIPVWRFGTPGFAMVFGLGVGALGLTHFADNPRAFARSTRFNTRLIVGGVLLLGLMKFLIILAEGRFGERLPMSGIFYSVITYYALAMLALPILVRLMSIGPNRLATILILAGISLTVAEVMEYYVAPLRPPAALEFVKIVLSARYGFFRMTFYVMVGAAIGFVFRNHRADGGIIRDLMLFAIVIAGFGAIGIWQADVENLRRSFGFAHLWQLAVYAGLLLIFLAGFSVVARGDAWQGHMGQRAYSFFIASGILALPIFVGHELVLALKGLGDALGVPDLLSLSVVLIVFFAAMIWAYSRVMRYFVRPA